MKQFTTRIEKARAAFTNIGTILEKTRKLSIQFKDSKCIKHRR